MACWCAVEAKLREGPEVRIMSTTSSAPLRCDICLQKDDWKGLKLQQCIECGVAVHEECYGLVGMSSYKPGKFACYACQAVGHKIQGATIRGKTKTILQRERPMECVLCAVNYGPMHAMHPLYNDYGSNGRQLILPAGHHVPERLGWVHTLCAMSICDNRNTKGCVYGCDENGDYEGEEANGVHRFVMCGLVDDEKDKDWVRLLKEHRRELKCIICGEHDKSGGKDLRVPIQCCAGDDDEYKEFKKFHEKLREPCSQAMHVGCAMWGTRRSGPPMKRRMWFFPGGTEDSAFSEPITEMFCDQHAREMDSTMYSLKGSARSTPTKESSAMLYYAQDDAKKPVPAEVLPSYTSPSVERRASLDTPNSKRKECLPKRGAATSTTFADMASSKPSKSNVALSEASRRGPSLKSTSTAHSGAAKASKPRESQSKSVASSSTSAIPRKAKDTSSATTTSAAAIPRKASAPVSMPEPAKGHVSSASHKSTTSSVPVPAKGQGTATTTTQPSTQPSIPPFTTPPPIPKRKRIRSISEEKSGDPNDDAMSISSSDDDDEDDAIRVNVESSSETKDPDGIWMNDDIQGLVETEELPPAAEPPEGGGANPWAYLWEKDAPTFELEITSRAERMSVKRVTES